VTVRPSGTEPKIKMYFEVFGKPFQLEDIDAEKEKIIQIRKSLEKNVMRYCYQLLDVDFPDRGFLLFWQLPLDVKLKYFEIENELIRLKDISDIKERKAQLHKLLQFLGANPIEKVDKAFMAKYQKGILDYLNLTK
jgi:phosphoglucomutase/phosphomannomutase